MHDLLRNAKQFNKFCKRFNTDFKCKSAFGCSTVCPLYWFREIDIMMEQKNLSLGDAYRLMVRKEIGKPLAAKILEQFFGVDIETLKRALDGQNEQKEDNNG